MKHHLLKIERERRNWSQSKLAQALGTTHKTVSRWEQGQVAPSPYYREQLCLLFGKNAYELGFLFEQDGESDIVLCQQTPYLAPKISMEPFLLDPAIPEPLERDRIVLGRDLLLEQLKHTISARGSFALTALQGLPGIGKTTLALALTAEADIREQFADGILWVGLGLQPNILAQLGRWGALLGIEPRDVVDPASSEEWSRTLHTFMGSRRMLLIIDDAWNVEDALAFRIGGKHCAHLVTTRLPQMAFAFTQEQERVLVVPELVQADAVRLLARFIPQLVAQDQEGALSLVNAVGALPLALTVLGKYLASQALSGQPRRLHAALEKLHKIEQRLQVSIPIASHDRSPSFPSGTPLSLQATIAISDQQLSHQAQAMLRALAVFPAKPNSFSEAAALAVSQQSEEILDLLWDAGLLESSSTQRYMLHQTVVDYARIQAGVGDAQQRLVFYMVRYLREHEQEYALLEQESSNILMAFDTAIQLSMWPELIQGVTAFEAFQRVRGLYQQADYYFTQALQATVVLGDEVAQMLMLRSLAFFAEVRGDYDQAEKYSRQGLALAQRFQRGDVESDLLTTLGMVTYRHGDHAQARTFYERGLQLARQVGESERICKLLDYLGIVFRLQENHLQAQALCEEGLMLARRDGHLEHLSSLLSALAITARDLGNYTQAEQYAQEGLTVANQLGHRANIARLLANLGVTASLRGDYQQAEDYFQEALLLIGQTGLREIICNLLANLGALKEVQGQYIQAQNYLQEGIELARQLKYRTYQAHLLINLGCVFRHQKKYEQAHAILQESVELSRQIDSFFHLSCSLLAWGELHLVCLQIDAASQAFQDVLILIEKKAAVGSHQDLVAQAYYGLARVASVRLNFQEAERLGKESLMRAESVGNHTAKEIRQWLASVLEKAP